MPYILGKFGKQAHGELPCTFGMNAKGGMDEKEFEEYIMNSIIPLFPDARNVRGKRVMIKIDSGPGQLNPVLIARLCLLGFVLYPSVPNTTAVSQETDRNYGPFKTAFRKNLNLIFENRIKSNKKLNLQPWIVG